MTPYHRALVALTMLLIMCSAHSSHAQSFSIGLRGTGAFPTGAFAETGATPNDALIKGAKSGFGYGLDLGVSLGMFGVYAGFDRINFDCETSSCTNNGEFKLQGVSVGAKLMPNMMTRFRPFLKGGVTFNTLEGVYGGNSSGNRLTTDRAPGYEIGIGGNIALAGMLALTPQLRYVGQNLRAEIPGVSVPSTPSDGVNYFTFDLGLSFTPPFRATAR